MKTALNKHSTKKRKRNIAIAYRRPDKPVVHIRRSHFRYLLSGFVLLRSCCILPERVAIGKAHLVRLRGMGTQLGHFRCMWFLINSDINDLLITREVNTYNHRGSNFHKITKLSISISTGIYNGSQ